ncbi:MAG: alpha/beta hydrolase [Clostridia bacterium]
MKEKRCKTDAQLRSFGAFIRLINPYFTEKKFRVCNWVLDRFRKGKHVNAICYEEKWILREDGSQLRICIYRSPKVENDVPGVLWLHGGGYATGIPEQDDSYAQRLIERSGCVVVAPDYCRSVDRPYPAALMDCYTALLWMKEHSPMLGIRINQLMVGGDSAGGGLTAALTLYARDNQEVAIAFQMPLYPMLDDRMNSPSAMGNNAPVWNSISNECGWKLYLGNSFKTEQVSAYAAPARAKSFRNLPPTVTFVGELEPFRDETVFYVRALREQGIPVQFELFSGCYHAFDQCVPKAAVAKRAIEFFLDAYEYAVLHYFAEQPE